MASSSTVRPDPDMNQRLPVVPTEAAASAPVPADPTPTPLPAPAPIPQNASTTDDEEEDPHLFTSVSIIALILAGLYSLNSFFTYLGTFSTFSRLFIALGIFVCAIHFGPMIFNDDGEDDSLLPPVWRKVRKVLPERKEVREYIGKTWPMTMLGAGNINAGLCAGAVYASVWHARGWEWEGVTAGCVVFWMVLVQALVQALGREVVSRG